MKDTIENKIVDYSKENNVSLIDAYVKLSDIDSHSDVLEAFEIAEHGIENVDKIDERQVYLHLILNKSKALNIMGRFQDMITLSEPIIASFVEPDANNLKYKIYLYYAKALSVMGDTKLVFEVFDLMQTSFNEATIEGEDLGEFYNLKGITYLSNGYLNLSFENHVRALEIREANKDYIHQIQSHTNLSSVYKELKEKEKATLHLKAALCISEKIESNPIIIYISFITNAIADKDYKEADKWLKLAIPIGEKIEHRLMMATLRCFEATVRANIGDKQEAVQVFEDLEKSILETAYYGIICDFYSTYGDLMLSLKKVKKAIAYYKLALNEIKEYKEYALLYTIYLKLSKAFEANVQTKKALKYYKKYSKEFNKSVEDNKANAIAEMQIRFETAQKEKEAEKFQTESLKYQLQSLRSQMNPHFVFNAISSISDDMEPATMEKSRALMESFARLMRSNLAFAEQEKITLEEEITFLNDYLLLEQNRLGEKLKFEINYSEDLDLDFIEIPSMLIQPYIENAIKHGILPLKTGGLIQIEFIEDEDVLICVVRDNGVGRKQAALKRDKLEKHLGKSTSITATRLNLLSNSGKENVTVLYTDLEDEKGQAIGTEVSLKIAL